MTNPGEGQEEGASEQRSAGVFADKGWSKGGLTLKKQLTVEVEETSSNYTTQF